MPDDSTDPDFPYRADNELIQTGWDVEESIGALRGKFFLLLFREWQQQQQQIADSQLNVREQVEIVSDVLASLDFSALFSFGAALFLPFHPPLLHPGFEFL